MRYVKFFLFLLIGVICMMQGYGCNSSKSGFKYAQYSSKNPELNITMAYLSDWICHEHQGISDTLAGVLFFENRKDKNFKAKIALSVTDNSKIKLKSNTLEAMTEDLVNKRLRFKQSLLLSDSTTKIQGVDAKDILLSYKQIDKLYSLDAKLIPVKERIIVFKRGDKFYTLRYENTSEDFDKFNPAFSQIIKTMKFK